MSSERKEPAPSDLLSKKEVARKVGVSPRTISRYVAQNKLPRPIRFSRVCVRWCRKDIDEYLERLSAAGRSGSGGSAA
jgi:predicted DNA-binding transcriptional regulator AlpA